MVLGNKKFDMITESEIELIAEGWLQYTRVDSSSREHAKGFQYWDQLLGLALDDPEMAWKVIRVILKRGATEAQIVELASGPFEEVLRAFRANDLRSFSRDDQNLVSILSKYVWWKRIDPEVHDLVKEISAPRRR